MVVLKNKFNYIIISMITAAVFLPVQAFAQSAEARLQQLEKQMQTMSRAVYRGEMPNNYEASTNDIANSNAANIEIRISDLETQLRDITGKLERFEHENRLLKKRLERLEMPSHKKTNAQQINNTTPQTQALAEVPTLYAMPRVENRINSTKEQLGVLKVPETADQTYMPVTRPTTITSNDTPEKLYEEAYTNIRNGKYKEAADEFETFLNKYPNNNLSPNAQYWLAETYYVRGKYQTAAKLFAKGYETYPKSVKTADNLLKLGLSLSKTGKKEEACVTFAQLEKQFPGKSGVIMQRSRQEQKRIGCE